MVKYSPWNIKTESFQKTVSIKEKLCFLLQFAILAPSTHNSQPWKFQVSDNSISIYRDRSRSLPIADPTGRLELISLGCLLKNLLVAADYFGFHPKVSLLKNSTAKLFATIDFSLIKKKSTDRNHLIFTILNRHTNRHRYEDRMPEIKSIERALGFADKSLITLITDADQKCRIAKEVLNFRLEIFDNKSFRKELSNYKKSNWTKSHVGMPGFTMGFNTLFSLFAPFVIRNFNIMKLFKHNELALLTKFTPVFLIISTPNDAFTDWVKAGLMFEEICLRAQKENIQTAISAFPREKIRKLLGITKVPQIFLRVGYSQAIGQHSPRIPSHDLIEL